MNKPASKSTNKDQETLVDSGPKKYFEKGFLQSEANRFAALFPLATKSRPGDEKQLGINSRIEGKIVAIQKDHAIVDCGLKAYARVPLVEFGNASEVSVGTTYKFILLAFEDSYGSVLLSRERASKQEALDYLLDNHKEGSLVVGVPTRMVKGGLLCRIATPVGFVEAFIPASHAGVSSINNLADVLNVELPLKIIKIDKERSNIVLSSREVRKEQFAEQRKKLLSELEVESVVRGRIKNIIDFGIFIDLGGIDGLLHISDVSWIRSMRGDNVLAKYKLGDEIDVKVLSITNDETTQRVALGLKQMTENPWIDIQKSNPAGSEVEATVEQPIDKGVIVKVKCKTSTPGEFIYVSGFIARSEISWFSSTANPEDFKIDQPLKVQIMAHTDPRLGKLNLSLRNTTQNPWLTADKDLPKDSIQEGKVIGHCPYGLIIKFNHSEMQAICPPVEISHTNAAAKDAYKPGTPVKVVVTKVDTAEQVCQVSIRQAVSNPWQKIEPLLPVGKEVECKFVKQEGTSRMIVQIPALDSLAAEHPGVKEITAVVRLSDFNSASQLKSGDLLKATVTSLNANESKQIELESNPTKFSTAKKST